MQWIRSGVFIVNFKHNLNLALLFPLLTLTSWKVSGFIVRVEASTNSKREEGSQIFYEKWSLAKRGDPIKKVVPDFLDMLRVMPQPRKVDIIVEISLF